MLTYFVWPILCTRPMACSSAPTFNPGSTRMTWVASTMFNPFEPECSGISNTFMSVLFLNSDKLSCDTKPKQAVFTQRHILVEMLGILPNKQCLQC